MPASPSKLDHFFISHAVASTLVVGGTVGAVFVLYCAGFLIAVVFGAGLGSPIALPLWLLFSFVVSCGAVATVIWPATLIGGWLADRLRLSVLWEIALVTALASAVSLSVAVAYCGGLAAGVECGSYWMAGLAIPLGAYWWSLRSTDWVLSTVGRAWRGLRSKAHSLPNS